MGRAGPVAGGAGRGGLQACDVVVMRERRDTGPGLQAGVAQEPGQFRCLAEGVHRDGDHASRAAACAVTRPIPSGGQQAGPAVLDDPAFTSREASRAERSPGSANVVRDDGVTRIRCRRTGSARPGAARGRPAGSRETPARPWSPPSPFPRRS